MKKTVRQYKRNDSVIFLSIDFYVEILPGRGYFIGMDMRVANYWERNGDTVECLLCPTGCIISEGGSGFCKVRGVREGELKALGYGKVSSAHLDPIEKKPLNDFFPGSMIYSIGGWGCNLSCAFCQNWSISQEFHDESRVYEPADIVDEAKASGSIGIAYTYNEPLISFEFVRDCAQLARSAGLVNVLVTNGYINTEPASELLSLVDALNIDIKSMDPEFYKTHCGGELNPVLDFAVQANAAGCHVEITNLVIPGLNDSDDLFVSLADWIYDNLGAEVPLHLSAYHPQYKMVVNRTPPETLLNARDLCEQRLKHVYLGNV